MIDPEKHVQHPSGFYVDKETGVPMGIAAVPPQRVSDETEWPKWIVPHEAHIVRREVPGSVPHISVPHFPDFHINRHDGSVMVQVKDAAEEEKALAAPKADEKNESAAVKSEKNAEEILGD